MFGGDRRIRLAPLHDLGNALQYPSRRRDKLILSMKIGNTYRLRDIRRHHWEKLLHCMHVNVDAALARITAMAAALPDHASDLAHAMRDEGFDHPILQLLSFLLAESSMEKTEETVDIHGGEQSDLKLLVQ